VPRFATMRAIIENAIQMRVFPGAVVEIGSAEGVVWQEAFGRLTYEPGARPAEIGTVYDLASLTKVIVTTSLVMRLVDERRLALQTRLSADLQAWRGADRDHVTIRHLLAHSAGLEAWFPLFRACSGRQAFETAICGLPLAYPPGTAAVYSDLGFILLGFLVADAGGAALDAQWDGMTAAVVTADSGAAPAASIGNSATSTRSLRFQPPAAWLPRIAPTEIDPWRGRLLVGEVHDENCWALGGVAGHAGLFGTAPAVGRFARSLLRARLGIEEAIGRHDTVRAFTTRQSEPGSSRGLGWDMMLPTSSCGTRMSPDAFGHTGYTGTSLWIDPVANVYVVLLTNRVHPSRSGNEIARVRPDVHDAIMAELHAA
jgi:CubicO group peptidase (beta-lactamase class C family)